MHLTLSGPSYLVLSGDELSVEGALHEGREERLAQDRLPELHQLKLGSNHEDGVIIIKELITSVYKWSKIRFT